MLLIHRLFIKTALVFLTLGVAAGGWMLLRQAGVALPELRNLYTLHIHLIGVGFLLMMICGVAFWMFPRKSGETREEAARDPLGWTAYLLLTVGLAVRGVGHLAPEWLGNPALIGSVVLQVGGVLAFVIAIWPRIYLPGAKVTAAPSNRK
jgi:hypothetical protein